MRQLHAWMLGSLLAATVVTAGEPALTLTSPDLPEGQPFADRYVADTFGCHGGNESPALQWRDAPPGTKSFAVTMYDPHTPPVSGWWHWVVYDIPATVGALPRNAGGLGSTGMPIGAKQLRPDGEAPQAHYYGPCPDEGDAPHRYTITVYALSVDHLDIPPTSTPANLDYELLTKTLAKAAIVVPFTRPKRAP